MTSCRVPTLVRMTMTYRRLGDSGLAVSTAGLGCNTFGATLDPQDVDAVVGAAHALFCKTFVCLPIKMAVAKEEQFGTAAYFGLAEKERGSGRDSHIDLMWHAP